MNRGARWAWLALRNEDWHSFAFDAYHIASRMMVLVRAMRHGLCCICLFKALSVQRVRRSVCRDDERHWVYNRNVAGTCEKNSMRN